MSRNMEKLNPILERLKALGVPQNRVDSLYLYADQALDAVEVCDLENAITDIMSLGHDITGITGEVARFPKKDGYMREAIYNTITEEFIPQLISELNEAIMLGCNCHPKA